MSILWELGQPPWKNVHHGQLLGEPHEAEDVSPLLNCQHHEALIAAADLPLSQ